MFRHILRLCLAALAAASLLAAPARAAFPERPITLIVPWAAGGGTDAIARQVAMMLEREFKQPVNVVGGPAARGRGARGRGRAAGPRGVRAAARGCGAPAPVKARPPSGARRGGSGGGRAH